MGGTARQHSSPPHKWPPTGAQGIHLGTLDSNPAPSSSQSPVPVGAQQTSSQFRAKMRNPPFHCPILPVPLIAYLGIYLCMEGFAQDR